MKNLYLLLFALLFIACNSNQDNNKSLDYEELDVNFSVRTTGFDMPENTTYGIAAYCARGNQDGVQMNGQKEMSVYKSIAKGESADLIKVSDADRIEALADDNNFKFYVVYPYSDNINVNAVAAAVPSVQEYEQGVKSYLAFTANKRVTSVVPTVELDAKTPFAVLNLSVPADIVEEGVPSVLKSVTITPAVADNFTGAIAGEGTIDAETGAFTLSANNRSASIKLNFPSEGLALDGKSTIPVAVIPFTVPDKGFNIEFKDMNGSSLQTSFLAQESDKGAQIKAGEVSNVAVTRYGDGIVPVTFPVEFPLGNFDNVKQFTADKQPDWISKGIWVCDEQPQAYAEWRWMSNPDPAVQQLRETVNSGTISSPGVKGIWTGDHFEFVIPVRNIEANTQIKMEFPYYGRAVPIFWNVKYLDGGAWKIADESDKTFTIADDSETRTCTFTLARDKIQVQSHIMTLENEVKSGYLRFRIECADGSVLGSVNGATPFIERVTRPWTATPTSSVYGAPFYLNTKAETPVKGVVFSLVQ